MCGGAGYIGSPMLGPLTDLGLEPVVLDNLSTGHREAVKIGGWMNNIKFLVGVFLICIVVAGSGCHSTNLDQNHPNISGKQHLKKLIFAVSPLFSDVVMREEFKPLMEYLSDVLKCKVELKIVKEYKDLIEGMELGNIDIADMHPFAYVTAYDAGKATIIVQAIVEGSSTYSSLIIAKDSKIKTLKDLVGKRVAFVDPKSSSGYIYPRALLIEKGIIKKDQPFDKYFEKILFVGSHEKVIAAVLDGSADAGAVWSGAIDVAKANGFRTDSLKVIAETKPIPHELIAARSSLDPQIIAKIREAMLALNHSEIGKKFFENSKRKKFTGFAIGDPKAFDTVRQTAKLAGQY